MEVIKKDIQRKLEVGDIVKVAGETRFSDIGIGTLATVTRFDEDDSELKIEIHNDYDFATAENLKFIARPSESEPVESIAKVTVELNVEDIKHIAGALYETDTIATDQYLRNKGIAKTKEGNSVLYHIFYGILQEVA